MSDETKNMIDAATNQDGAAFKAAFDTAINNRVGENLQTQRQDIAQNIFGNIRVPSEVTEAPKDAAAAKRRAAKVEADDRQRIVGRQQAQKKAQKK